MNSFGRYFPILVVVAAAVYLGAAMIPPSRSDEQMQLQDFGRIPVVHQGRVKPIDTMARTSLMLISNKDTFLDENDKRQPAIKWLLDLMISDLFKNDAALRYKVFRIENYEVLDLLKLEGRPGFYRYAFKEFADKLGLIQEKAVIAEEKDKKEQTVFDAKIMTLAGQVQLFLNLRALKVPLFDPPLTEDEEWKPFQGRVASALLYRIGMEKGDLRERLDKTRQAILHHLPEGSAQQKAEGFLHQFGMLYAYAEGNASVFNDEVASYQRWLDRDTPVDTFKCDVESFLNRAAPFFHCTWLYLAVFLLACLGWLGWSEPLNRAAFWLAVLLLAVHSAALFSRMYLLDRWWVFVINLYSSALFIGWGGVLLGLILERVSQNGVGCALAGLVGFSTLMLAPHLLEDGKDGLEMMQAVLDTNFWLATHVTCVAFGYTATFVAGLLGVVYIVGGVFTTAFDQKAFKKLSQMIYGVVCFAMLLSFTGTVLGGLWADWSWGRFWGWDPKENGALLIVLMNALILHARWGGVVKQRGVAVLAVVGNMVTGWSWFGTNQLGVGLHAYGFNDKLAAGLVIFWVSQLVIIGIGLLPTRLWQSYATQAQPVGVSSTPVQRSSGPTKKSNRRDPAITVKR
jgi:ABC-type transport system involved in cytochrome c biogenesis permease subunit